jgi:hypothetical protein
LVHSLEPAGVSADALALNVPHAGRDYERRHVLVAGQQRAGAVCSQEFSQV